MKCLAVLGSTSISCTISFVEKIDLKNLLNSYAISVISVFKVTTRYRGVASVLKLAGQNNAINRISPFFQFFKTGK